MTEAEARAAIVAEAMSWIDTPYHHHARIKGVGVDCAQLPAAVYHAVGLIPDLQPEYSPQWMLHRDEEQYLAWVRPHAREIERDQLEPGDLVMWKFGRTYSHSAIVIERPTIIHAVNRAGRVELGDMDRDADLISRPSLYFSLFVKD
ncbi:C40 family peptidase [Novosphingobium piscinae]|uniref:C40 family peptidase n=1 Tax=Novosphingobium piscinae TaxID=1507448 RepID=A0A7X1KPI6_9SPHN|nr:C40 family peptidase [Novosphingobium piscinae]